MPTPNTINSDLLSAITREEPAGEDLYPTPEWLRIRDARPNAYEIANKGIWAPQNPPEAGWSIVKERATSALLTKSKDLRIATLLSEANIHIHGFAGLRDSLQLIRELLVRYWDSGLYPLAENSDLEFRLGTLEWLNVKLSDAIRAIPLAGNDYSSLYFQESLKPHGIISREEFASAVQTISVEQYRTWFEDLEQASIELSQLNEAVERLVGPDISFFETEAALDDCRHDLYNIMANRNVHAQHN